MIDYTEYFKGKKITVMGLGLLGRGLGYTKFLADCGADLIVTDLKPSTALRSSLKELRNYKNIKYTLGEHKLEDFRNRDIIMKMPGVPENSIYLKEAKKTGASIEMDVSLFAKLAPEVMIIGVTGTRGKSMTTQLIYEILFENIKERKVYLGGNVRGVATLPLLKKIKSRASIDTVRYDSAESDILVCELDSWQLQGFAEAKFSPHISVFTSFMPDHMNYYQNSMKDYFDDKANIFKFQKEKDFLITNTKVKNLIKVMPKSQIILADKRAVADFDFIVPGEHQRQNLAYAVAVAEILGIPKNAIRKSVKKFKGVEGRLQFLRNYKGIKIYNDNNATTPEATLAGIQALSHKSDLGRNIVLVCGGADKNLSLENLTKAINLNCKFVSFIPGSGTDKFLSSQKLTTESYKAKNLKEAIKKALEKSNKGDIILFSPAFASFGMYNNEYERNDEFVKIIKNLK